MSDNDGSSNAQAVAALFSRGRLTTIPRKVARREQLFAYLGETLFEPDREYDEQQVNLALRAVHDDCAALRRYLVIAGVLVRTRDGGTYRRAA